MQKQTQDKVVLQNIFGYHNFRQGQEEVIAEVLKGKDTLVIMPTGGGKSLCYQIPALMMPGLTLVISPLISLMKDQVDQLAANGVFAACLNSAMDFQAQDETWQALKAQQIKLLYVSPERVLLGDFIDRIKTMSVNLIAVDEAHCVSQWGHDFRPEYAKLGVLKSYFPKVPMMALTATADTATRDDICQRLSLQNPFSYQGSFDRPNIRYTLVEKHKPIQQLKGFLASKKGSSGIVYCNSRKRVDELVIKLNQNGQKAAAYHAGMSIEDRAKVQEAFQKDDLAIVVATVAFGMGINKSNVRFVVHYDIPRSIESYYQETGRAGRDGLSAEAMMLYSSADIAWLYQCLSEKPEGAQKQIEMNKLSAMGAFAEALTCRRQVLLGYFGEYHQGSCTNCDICIDPPSMFDGTKEAQKALSCVYRIGQNFGVNHTVDVLRGMGHQRIKEYQHDKVSTYGLGKEQSHEYWVSIFRQLIHLGYLSQNIARNSVLSLTEQARPLLRGEIVLKLAVPRFNLSQRTRIEKTIKGPYDKALFAKLRHLRKSLADENNIPPYVVFNDSSLTEMCQLLPTDQIQFLSVSGVGQCKLERYGDTFLALINSHLNDEPEII